MQLETSCMLFRFFGFLQVVCCLAFLWPSLFVFPCDGSGHWSLIGFLCCKSSLVIYFFTLPPIKLKLGRQIRGGTTNSKPPGPIIMISTNQKHWAVGRSYLFGLCLQVDIILCHLQSTANCACVLSQNHFLQLNQHILSFLFIQFYSAGSHTQHHWRCS